MKTNITIETHTEGHEWTFAETDDETAHFVSWCDLSRERRLEIAEHEFAVTTELIGELVAQLDELKTLVAEDLRNIWKRMDLMEQRMKSAFRVP